MVKFGRGFGLAVARQVVGRCAQQALVAGDLAGNDAGVGRWAKADAHIKGIVTQRGRVDREFILRALSAACNCGRFQFSGFMIAGFKISDGSTAAIFEPSNQKLHVTTMKNKSQDEQVHRTRGLFN